MNGTLFLSSPVLVSSGGVLVLGWPDDWRRSIRNQGGFWQGSFSLSEEDLPASELIAGFYEWLGQDLRERTAPGKTWEGLVYEMELAHRGSRRRRTLDLMANAVATSYQDGGEVTTSAYSTQAQAVARYGRKEELLSADNVPAATATALRDRYLAGNAWPWARPVSLGGEDETRPGQGTRLEIRACGYVFTAQWLYLQAGDGSDDDIDDWISAIVGTAEGLSSDHGGSTSGAGDCQFLSAGNLATNTLQVKTAVDSDTRPWSKIEELAGLGDSSGDPWRAWVDVDRKLHYQAVDLSPRYYLREGGIYDSAGGRVAVNPWAVRPGVVRDLAYPVRRSERGSSLSDARDQFVEEIEVSADGSISMSTAIFDEAGMLAAQAELQGE